MSTKEDKEKKVLADSELAPTTTKSEREANSEDQEKGKQEKKNQSRR